MDAETLRSMKKGGVKVNNLQDLAFLLFLNFAYLSINLIIKQVHSLLININFIP
jgi:hypothetical protein